jgi:hypothetical protein
VRVPPCPHAVSRRPEETRPASAELTFQWLNDPPDPAVSDQPALVQYREDMAAFAPDADADATFTLNSRGGRVVYQYQLHEFAGKSWVPQGDTITSPRKESPIGSRVNGPPFPYAHHACSGRAESPAGRC